MIRQAVGADLGAIRELLLSADLPVADIGGSAIEFLVDDEGGRVVGVVGLQRFGATALLRSLAVTAGRQGGGAGRRLVDAAEARACATGITGLALLTTTAAPFFARLGYAVTRRDAVDDAVRQSAEFRSLCPASAVCMAKVIARRKRVLFVCVENSNRSQMAEAFARRADARIEALSAGSAPSGKINPKAIRFMREIGVELDGHSSKSLDDIDGEFDAVVTMGCGDNCPWIPSRRREDWELPDPRDLGDDGYRAVRDEIGVRVHALLASL